MSDPQPGQGSGGQQPPAPLWHEFGVPHGGPPEPPAYTPAMRERTRPVAVDESASEDEASAATLAAAEGRPVVTSVAGDHALGSTWGSPSPEGSAPAMGERRVPEGATQQIPTQQTEQIPWWGGGPAEPQAYAAPPATDLFGHPAPVGEPYPQYAEPWPPVQSPAPVGPGGTGGPGGPWGSASAAPTPPARRGAERRRWAGLAALALVAALLGGGVVLAGQHLLDRSTSLGSAVPAPGPGSTARPDGSIAKIAADALPSVVTIRIKTTQGQGTGSGFVIDKQGHILTNNHVVAAAGGSSQISVELNNGTTIPATVVGADASYDLAVLKVSSTDLAPLEFGASKDVVVGDGVIAVGAPLGLDATVTSGIVSALDRPVAAGDSNDQSYINAIQTDAAINPGNSGGPLLDMNGRVIGVNSAIARIPGSDSSTGGSIGVGFAIPSDQAAKTAQQLITTGKAEHPALGVRVDQSYTGDGAKLASGGVQSGSAADQAGLKEGDIITAFEGKKVTDANALIVAIRARNVGDAVKMTVQRGGQTVDVTMTLQASSS